MHQGSESLKVELGVLVGRTRRLLSVTGAQAECLLSRLIQVWRVGELLTEGKGLL